MRLYFNKVYYNCSVAKKIILNVKSFIVRFCKAQNGASLTFSFFFLFIYLLTILTISTLLTNSNNNVYNSTMNKVTVHNANLYYIT